ncbi:LVIVD repeat-containing protein [Piscinibacter sakaiensis]|uniref:LVIVD repeat-containing protein n=1 Tax=Piscinibacter sakaiensis TaxID=1547922 RepID=UPI003AADA01B
MDSLAPVAPASRAHQTLAHNMTLLAHHELEGFGGMGEGIAMQLTDDGRRVLWMAHESAPKNFTAVEVTDPRRPKVLVQTELPHMKVRSNSLDVSGNLMAVAYQTQTAGLKPAGFDLWNISVPERPELISHFDCSGPFSRGVHALWFVDGKTVHIAAGAPDFQPHNPRDHQFYRIIDVSEPTRPVEAGRWWMPGTRVGDSEPQPARLPPQFDTGFRAHNTNVFPDRPDRAYVGYIDGGAVVLDIANPADIKVVSTWNHSPPFNGFTHTVLPLFSRDLWIVSDECVQDDGKDWPKLVWVVDARSEAHPLPIGTFPMPPPEVFAKRGGRFGAHNLHENLPVPGSFCSDTIIIGTFFNGGVRVYDTSNPYRVEEIAYFVPGAPRLSPVGAVQLNDVFVDEKQIVYTIDRFGGGLYILEMNI